MRLRVRPKIFAIFVAAIMLTVVSADVFLERRVAARVTEMIRADLFVRADLVGREAAGAIGLASWDDLADAEGAAARARVTLIAEDGVVLGDSDLAAPAVATLENHRGRPEVAAALASGRGSDVRRSATVKTDMMYVAIRFRRADGGRGVARIAEPLGEVSAAIASVRRLIILAAGIAMITAIVLSSIAAERIAILVRELTSAARRMTSGDLDVRTRLTGHDELAELGRALDELAENLSSTRGELRSERDLHVRILEGMQEGVIVLDEVSRIELVNPALRTMMLLTGDVTGRPLPDVIEHPALTELLRGAQKTDGVTLGEIDLPGIKPRRLLVHAAALAGSDGGLVAVFVDVTDLRRLESLRRDFVANVSHELRTPVASVRSAAETLRGPALKDPDAALRFVTIIERNAQRLQALIEDLIELSRLESKEFRLKCETVDLAAVSASVFAMLRDKADRKGVSLVASFETPTPELLTDVRAVEQIVTNLVENAVKYAPTGATVTVSAKAGGEGVAIAVEDTGPGIDEKHLARLFERFYRVDAGRSREVGGTGLGLSIVKHLAEAMGGGVSVASERGRGSIFTVTVPRVPPARETEPTEVTPSPMPVAAG